MSLLERTHCKMAGFQLLMYAWVLFGPQEPFLLTQSRGDKSNGARLLHCNLLFFITKQASFGGSYTEPRILMDSIRSPGRLLKLHQESTWSPSGVHLESIRMETDRKSVV